MIPHPIDPGEQMALNAGAHDKVACVRCGEFREASTMWSYSEGYVCPGCHTNEILFHED